MLSSHCSNMIVAIIVMTLGSQSNAIPLDDDERRLMATIPVRNTTGSEVYVDLDQRTSELLHASILAAKADSFGWRRGTTLSQGLISNFTLRVDGRVLEEGWLTHNSIIVFKDQKWKPFSDTFIRKLALVQVAALSGEYPPNETAEQVANAFRDGLKAAGLGGTVRK